jgi:hypothetical protein
MQYDLSIVAVGQVIGSEWVRKIVLKDYELNPPLAMTALKVPESFPTH